MKWTEAPRELVTFLAESLRDVDCQTRKIFGYPAYSVNDNMFIAARQDNLVIRRSREDRQSILDQYAEVMPFEPMPGRVTKAYEAWPESLYRRKDRFSEILAMSVKYVSSLPRKKAKKRRKR